MTHADAVEMIRMWRGLPPTDFGDFDVPAPEVKPVPPAGDQSAASKLWMLLDDIDTLDDACRNDDRAFRDFVRKVQQKRFAVMEGPHCSPMPAGEQDRTLRNVAQAARDWIGSAPHGDNCFVSDHYEGDPGTRCNCGKEALMDALDAVIPTPPEGEQEP